MPPPKKEKHVTHHTKNTIKFITLRAVDVDRNSSQTNAATKNQTKIAITHQKNTGDKNNRSNTQYNNIE